MAGTSLPPSYQDAIEVETRLQRKETYVQSYISNISPQIRNEEQYHDFVSDKCTLVDAAETQRRDSTDDDSIAVSCDFSESVPSEETKELLDEMEAVLREQETLEVNGSSGSQRRFVQILADIDDWFCDSNKLQVAGMCILLSFIVIFVLGIILSALKYPL